MINAFLANLLKDAYYMISPSPHQVVWNGMMAVMSVLHWIKILDIFGNVKMTNAEIILSKKDVFSMILLLILKRATEKSWVWENTVVMHGKNVTKSKIFVVVSGKNGYGLLKMKAAGLQRMKVSISATTLTEPLKKIHCGH